MADRIIRTAIKFDGEAEYRASMSRINAEVKNLQSALKLTQSEFQNSANTIEALQAKHESLTKVIEAQHTKVEELKKVVSEYQNLQKNLGEEHDRLTKEISENSEALEKLRAAGKGASDEAAKLAEKDKELHAALEKVESAQERADKKLNGWQKSLNTAQIEVNNLNAELQNNDKLLDEAKNSTDGCAHSIDEFGNEVKESSNAVDALAQALAAAGLAKTAEEIAKALKDCIDSSIAFESAMTGVSKTTDLSDKELDDMAAAIKTLTTQIPITATEFAGIAEAAGQLGIAKEDLLDFSTVMANLGVATNMTAEEAAVMLAQFANITNMDPGDFERLGSVVVDLGNNFATNEREITEMSQRLASAGTLAGLTEPEIMALSTAMASVGIQAEAGGTAMAQTLSKIETAVATGSDSLDLYAQVAGMSAGEFANAWENKPIIALQSFIEGLGRLDENGESVTLVLEELDLKGIRQSNMLKALGTASGLLASAVDTANTAWKENNALQTEAEKRYATTESKIQLYKNSVENLKIAIGNQLTPALGNLASMGQETATWAAKMVEENEWLAPTITVVTTAVIGFTGSLSACIAVIKAVELATTALNGSLLANPFTLATTAAVTLTTALVALAATLPDTRSEYDKLSEVSKDQFDRLQALNKEYEEAVKLYGANSEEARRLSAIIAEETANFERNKTTRSEIVDKTTALITKNEELGRSSADAKESIEHQRESSGYLIDKLNDLMGQEKKSAGTKQQILAVVSLLNQQIPELGLHYDDLNDKLSDNADNIQEIIDKTLARRELEANIADLLEREETQRENERALVDLRNEQATATEHLTQLTEEMNAALAEDDGDESRRAVAEMTGYISAVQDAKNYVAELAEKEQTLTGQMAENGDEIERLNGLVSGYSDQTEEAASAAEAAAEAGAAAATSISGKLTELAEKYAATYDACKNSIEGQFGLWEKAPYVTAKSVDEMLEALNSQADWWEWYSQYLDELRARDVEGVDEFLAKIADGSVESAAILMGLSTASDEEFAKVIASMNRVGDNEATVTQKLSLLRTNLSGELSLLAEEYKAAVEGINGTTAEVDFSPFWEAAKTAFENVGAQFLTVGQDSGIGLQNGIALSSGQVYLAANGMAQGIVDAAKTVLDENSPSKAMQEIGEYADEGLAQGIEGAKDRVSGAAETMGAELIERMTETGRQSVESFDAEFQAIEQHTRETLEKVRIAVGEYKGQLTADMENLGADMVEGMARGIYDRSGYLYSAMQAVVRESIEAARQAADVHSPSKKTQEIFENVGEGMVVGIERKKARVAEATQGVVDRALHIDTSGMIEAIKMLDARKPDTTPILYPSVPASSDTRIRDVTVNVNMAGSVIREEADVKKISRQIAQDVAFAVRQRGHH